MPNDGEVMVTAKLIPTKRLCPMCKSDRITLWMGGYTGAMYGCPNCGYVGPVTIETSDNLPKEENKED